MGIVAGSAAVAALGGLGKLWWDSHAYDMREKILEQDIPASGKYKTNWWQNQFLEEESLMNSKKLRMVNKAMNQAGIGYDGNPTTVRDRAALVGQDPAALKARLGQIFEQGGVANAQDLAGAYLSGNNRLAESTQNFRNEAGLLQGMDNNADALAQIEQLKAGGANMDTLLSKARQLRGSLTESNDLAKSSRRSKTPGTTEYFAQEGLNDSRAATAFNNRMTIEALVDARNQANATRADAAKDRQLTLQLKTLEMKGDREDRRYRAERDDRRDRLQLMQTLMNGINNSARLLY